MGAQIHFLSEGSQLRGLTGESVQVLIIKLEDEYKLCETKTQNTEDIAWWLEKFPLAWAETAGLGHACLQAHVYMEFKTQANPALLHQYPVSLEGREGIKPHIDRLLQLEVLPKCCSTWNTVLLLVKKPGIQDCHPV